MRYDPDRHHRRSIRLPEYDYSLGGSLFITICTHNRECLFGEVVDGEMRLNALGEIACAEWGRSAAIRRELEIDAYVLMPNHVHGIVTIRDRGVGATGGRPDQAFPPHPRATTGRPYGPPPRSVGAFVGGFKSSATRRINALPDTTRTAVWQRNYYERIIRNDDEFERTRWYIEDNPRRWAEDEYNPDG